VQVTVTVTDLHPEKQRVALSTVCTVQDKVVIEGDALILPTSAKRRKQ
jgi:3-hydroxybutyryl-CoA dehydratase